MEDEMIREVPSVGSHGFEFLGFFLSLSMLMKTVDS